MGIAALVLGILGLILCWFPYAGLGLALVGAILGLAAVLRRGGGLAVAGLVVATVALLVSGVFTVRATLAFREVFGEDAAALEAGSKPDDIEAAFDEVLDGPRSGTAVDLNREMREAEKKGALIDLGQVLEQAEREAAGRTEKAQDALDDLNQAMQRAQDAVDDATEEGR